MEGRRRSQPVRLPQVEASRTAGHGTPTPAPARPNTSWKAPRVWVPPEQDMFGGLGSRQQGITDFAQYEKRCNQYKELLRSSRALTKELEEQETELLRQKPSRDILHQLQDIMRMKLHLVREIKNYHRGIDLLQETIMRREPWQQMRAWDKGLPPIRLTAPYQPGNKTPRRQLSEKFPELEARGSPCRWRRD